MTWEKRLIEIAEAETPVMVIATRNKLQHELMDYLHANDFKAMSVQSHAQAAAILRDMKRQKQDLPPFIITGYQCSDAENAGAFLQGNGHQGIPVIGVVNHENQAAMFQKHGANAILTQEELADVISEASVDSEQSKQFLDQLNTLKRAAAEKCLALK